MNIDQRIEALTQSVELLSGMHKQTEEEIRKLTAQTRRFQYWAEAIILNYESRLRALAKEPPPDEVK